MKITLKDIRSGEGVNDFERTRNLVRRFTRIGITYDDLHRLAARVYRQLVDGETVELDESTTDLPSGVPDLSRYAGDDDLERAKNYIRETDPDAGKLDDGALTAQAKILLQKIEAALDNQATGVDEAADDPQLSAHAQAIRNLDARDPAFRKLTPEQRSFGPRVRQEAERVRERRRLAAERDEEPRLLADANSVAKPVPVAPLTRHTVTLAEIRTYPPYRGVDSDVARACSYLVERSPAKAWLRWEDLVHQGADLIRDLYRREDAGPVQAAGGAR